MNSRRHSAPPRNFDNGSMAIVFKLYCLFIVCVYTFPVFPQELNSNNSSTVNVSLSESREEILSDNLPQLDFLLLGYSLKGSTERHIKSGYLRSLRNRILHRPDLILEELDLNERQLEKILDLLEKINQEDIQLTIKRIAAMCEVWREGGSAMSDLDRANHALRYYSHLETLDSFRNIYRERFFLDLADEFDVELVAVVRAHMASFAETFHQRPISWESLIHTYSEEVLQMNSRCGPRSQSQ